MKGIPIFVQMLAIATAGQMHAQFAYRAAVHAAIWFSLAYLSASSVRGQLLYDARATFDMARIDLLVWRRKP